MIMGTEPIGLEDKEEVFADISSRSQRLAKEATKLYFRCAMFNEIALPGEGGILDQDERLVKLLEVVHGEIMYIREQQHKDISRPPTTTTLEHFQAGNIHSRTRRK